MDEIENKLVNKSEGTNSLERILDFLETNQGIFNQEKGAVIRLDSLGAKLRHILGNEQLIQKLRSYVSLLIPSTAKDTKDFLQHIRSTIFDSDQRLQAITDWIDLMRIPLNQLELTEEEFVGLVTRLEDADLADFNFQSMNLKKLTKLLLTPNLKFKTKNTIFLSTLAKLCAQNEEWTAKYIHKFAIVDESERIEIAKLSAQKNSYRTAESIQNFAIADEQARIDIAKCCAQLCGEGVARFMKNFCIKDKFARVEIAKLCAQQSGGWTASYIKDFSIQDEADRIEIAKICAQENGEDTAQFIQEFSIGDGEALVEIAKLCGVKQIDADGDSAAKYIHNFAIKDECIRIEIAKLYAKYGGTANYITNFDIVNEDARVEIARLCARQNGHHTALYIQQFTIAKEQDRIEIAKLCIEHFEGKYVPQFIQNFIIRDENARIEIAKLSSQRHGGLTARYIQNFAIENMAVRVEIAKLCAKQDGEGTAENIGNFAIKDEAVRIEIARLCASQEGGAGIAEYFQNFAIRDERIRIEIAKLSAKGGGSGTAKYIQKLAIKDVAVKVEIAKLLAQQNGEATAKYIQKFAIEDETVRIEIAKFCAQQNGRATAFYFQKFDLTNDSEIIEIAKLCAKQDGGGTAENVRNFAIVNESTRIEIAKLCARQNGEATAEYIKNFNLENPVSFYQLFLESVQSDPKSLFHMQKVPSLAKELTQISQSIQILNSEEADESRRNDLFENLCDLIKKLSISKENQKIILDMNTKIQTFPTHIQNAVCLWLISSILLMREMTPSRIEWLLETGIWSELGSLRDPILKVSLSSGLYALGSHGERAKLWEDFLSTVQGTEGQRGLMLLIVPFFNLQQQGIEEAMLLRVAKHLSTSQKKNESGFHNVYHVKNLLHTMHSLASCNELTADLKQRGLKKIFFDLSDSANSMLSDEREILKNVIAAKGLLQLKDAQWPNAAENLSDLFRSNLQAIIPLDEYKGDVSAKYEEIFGKCRNPGGLLTYAAGLKTLGDSTVLPCLSRYVVSVMDGTFKNKRYEGNKNPHLIKILERNSDLLAKWAEEITFDVHKSEDKGEESFDSEQWLHTKLVMDKHLGSEELHYLIDYLKAPSAEAKKEIFSAFINKIKELMKEEENKKLRNELKEAKNKIKEIETRLKNYSGNEEIALQMGQEKRKTEESLSSLKEKLNSLTTSRANDPLLLNLNLQKLCLKLAKEGKAAEKKTLIKHLEEIDEALQQEKSKTSWKRTEFAVDVKGLLEALRKQTGNHSEKTKPLKAIFTDDPIDLLLCGSDINGSCQRVDGDPKLNKGLLGYLIDGKNRLLAIKDGDKIVARSILRLLWDGKQPVVYRDRFYPDQIPIAHKQVLNALAKQVSQKLCAPLTCAEGSEHYNKNLLSLGGPAPYEYCDGAGGVQIEGRYTIQAKLLE